MALQGMVDSSRNKNDSKNRLVLKSVWSFMYFPTLCPLDFGQEYEYITSNRKLKLLILDIIDIVGYI